MIRVFKTGRHAHRTPLSYRALAPLFCDHITLVDTPEEADLYLFGHSLDIEAAPEALVHDWRRRRRPVVLLSEEPFWDTIWTGRPLQRQIYLDSPGGALPVVQLNHHTSAIFRFDRIPYYLLTNHRFVNAYRYRFQRNAARGRAAWQQHFSNPNRQMVFMFERRAQAYHDVSWEAGDIVGLCAWRTRLAQACTGVGVRRLGHSWQGGQTRWELPDWHLDKLVRLDDSVQDMAAFENTHQPDYVTEKFFDAMACGARPLYYASPGHRIHDFGLAPGSWLNLYGMSAQAAAATLAQAPGESTPDFLEGWCRAQAQLADLFGDVSVVTAERRRLQRAVLQELHAVLQEGVSKP